MNWVYQGFSTPEQPLHMITKTRKKRAPKMVLNLEVLRHIAQERGGLCLSTSYLGSGKKHRWRCREAHEWEACPSSVIHSKSWCPTCARSRQGREWIDFKAILDEIQKRGGECLTPEEEYQGCRRTILRLRCAEGHEWEIRAGNIRKGYWCRKCSGSAKRPLEDYQEWAHRKGGVCLSAEAKGVNVKHRWRCREGHEWTASPTRIRDENWCPKCSKRARLTLEDLQELGTSRGGVCLSTQVKGAGRRHRWRCADGHEWEATPASLRNSGTWCPECSGSRAERLVRCLAEALTGQGFPKGRPDWLRSPQGSQMELDGYCETLDLAFEYHGLQHYQEIKYYGKGGKSRLSHRKVMDAWKLRLCLEHGVRVLVIPCTVKAEEVETFLRKELCRLGIKTNSEEPVVLESLNVWGPGKLTELQELAKTRDGACLATAYLGSTVKHLWRCRKGHEWLMIPTSVKVGQWCPHCANEGKAARAKERRLSIEQIQQAARALGGECLSSEYKNQRSRLRFRCREGHEWETMAGHIVNSKSWCSVCRRGLNAAKLRLGINVAQTIAEERGGTCLSLKYVNTRQKLHWCCGRGHEWEARLGDVKNKGSWCPYCAGRRRLSVDAPSSICATPCGSILRIG